MMLQTAELNNGDLGNNGNIHVNQNRKRSSKKNSKSEMVISKADVVRIHVPYTPEKSNDNDKRLSAPR